MNGVFPRCNFSCLQPSQAVQWWKGSVLVLNTSSPHAALSLPLHLPHVRANDSGTYSCRTGNGTIALGYPVNLKMIGKGAT